MADDRGPAPPGRSRARARRRDDGNGPVTAVFGLTAFLIFLLMAVQIVFGLYARTVVTAIASDLAHDAAELSESDGEGNGPTISRQTLDAIETRGKARLGSYGDDATIRASVVDLDGDGSPDIVRVQITAALPVLAPTKYVPAPAANFIRTAQARIEGVR